ncbi:MAG: hypothetical protein V4526_03015 [Patescibacteria group bacterium]
MMPDNLFNSNVLDSQILECVWQALVFTLPHYHIVKTPAAGYFSLRPAQSGELFLVRFFGNCAPEYRQAYYTTSIQNGELLKDNPRLISSCTEKNPDEKGCGSAIRTNTAILSFAGYTRQADEAVVVMAARLLRLISQHECESIANLSGNEVLLKLLQPQS